MSDIDNLAYKRAVEPVSDSFGLLVSHDYGYRLLPAATEFTWGCGVYNSGNYDKAYQIALQGMSSVRINATLGFSLSYSEYLKISQYIINNVTNQQILSPMSYIDPSGVLKEMIFYQDSIASVKKIGGRFDIQLSVVTDTASAINYWRNSFFVNAITLVDGDKNFLEQWDIVYDDKIFYYLPQDVPENIVSGVYGGSIVEAAKSYGLTKKFFFQPDLPLQMATQPDYVSNDFPGSYPIRMKKGDFSYDYQGVQFEYSSISKKQILCMLHFLEHQYGYKNFDIGDVEIQQDLMESKWNTQQWVHSPVAGDYHKLSIQLNQNHLPKTF